MKKKVVFAIPNLEIGGAERVFTNFVGAIDHTRFQTYLLLVEKHGEFLQLIPDVVEIASLGLKRTLFSLWGIVKFVNRVQPDIIISTTNRMNIAILASSFFFVRKPKIVVREPSLPGQQIENGTIGRVMLSFIRFLYRRARFVMAQTRQMADEIVTLFRVSPKKVRILHNPIDYMRVKNGSEHGFSLFDGNNVNLVSVGRLHHVKGYDVLLRAMKIALSDEPRLKLHFIGDGPERQNLESLVLKLGLEASVHFWGFQINPYPYIKQANALVLTSRYEGFPNVVLEALYLKTPVVATRAADALDDLIIPSVNGCLVQLEPNSIAQGLIHVQKISRDFPFSYLGSDINIFLESC